MEIRCSGCNALFGKVHDGMLHIKSRELLRTFNGGVVWGPCIRCGMHNEWRADDDHETTR